MEENDEEKEPIDIEFTKKRAGPENDENVIDFRWSNEHGKRRFLTWDSCGVFNNSIWLKKVCNFALPCTIPSL